ncbi:hypothetical protein EON65_16250 [archaeon]|nr:MAG: hypothetical protein EON65_16250 [archaeon]
MNSANYGAVPTCDEGVEIDSETGVGFGGIEKQPEKPKLSYKLYGLNITVFLCTFLFYGFCIFEALSPVSMRDIFASSTDQRRLQSSESSGQNATIAVDCTITNSVTGFALGGAAGTALAVGALLALGLSPLGPIAGGWFAANMGAGLAAGSTMAMLQSTAMSAITYTTAAATGAAVGTTIASSQCLSK